MSPPDPFRHFDRPPPRRPARRAVLAAMMGFTAVVAAVEPKAFAMLLLTLLLTALVVAILTVKSLWRAWTRPIGTLTVCDAFLAASMVRWWRRCRDRRSVPRPSDPRRWAEVPGDRRSNDPRRPGWYLSTRQTPGG